MGPGIGYALAAMVCFGLGDFVFKRAAAAGVRPMHLLMTQTWVFFPLAIAQAAASGALSFGVEALWSGLAGVCFLVGFNAFLRGLANGPVTVAAPVFRLSFPITAGLAILVLGEPATGPKLLGLGLALAAIWLLLGGGGAGAVSRRFLVQVSVAAVALGLGNFCQKLALRAGVPPETALAAQAVVFTSLVTSLTLIGDRGYRVPAATWRHSVPSGLVLLGAFLFLLRALAVGNASTMVPIAQMGFVVTAALGAGFLGEPLTRRKLAGLAASIGALAVLIWG